MPTRSIVLPSAGSTATSLRSSSGRDVPRSLPYAPVSSLLSHISLTCRVGTQLLCKEAIPLQSCAVIAHFPSVELCSERISCCAFSKPRHLHCHFFTLCNRSGALQSVSMQGGKRSGVKQASRHHGCNVLHRQDVWACKRSCWTPGQAHLRVGGRALRTPRQRFQVIRAQLTPGVLSLAVGAGPQAARRQRQDLNVRVAPDLRWRLPFESCAFHMCMADNSACPLMMGYQGIGMLKRLSKPMCSPLWSLCRISRMCSAHSAILALGRSKQGSFFFASICTTLPFRSPPLPPPLCQSASPLFTHITNSLAE